MTMRFNSLGALALHLVEAEASMGIALEAGLERALVLVERTAVAKIGTYQEAVGPFPAWPELADSTEEQKAQDGYPADSPLLASGELQGSFGHEHEGFEGVVGSTDPNMVFPEFGTVHESARPVLGPAAFENKDKIERLVGAAAIVGLLGPSEAAGLLAGVIHEDLGYGLETKD